MCAGCCDAAPAMAPPHCKFRDLSDIFIDVFQSSAFYLAFTAQRTAGFRQLTTSFFVLPLFLPQWGPAWTQSLPQHKEMSSAFLQICIFKHSLSLSSEEVLREGVCALYGVGVAGEEHTLGVHTPLYSTRLSAISLNRLPDCGVNWQVHPSLCVTCFRGRKKPE